MSPFLRGILVGGALCSVGLGLLIHREQGGVDYTTLSEADLLQRKSEIQDLNSPEGRALLALIACIGHRNQFAEKAVNSGSTCSPSATVRAESGIAANSQSAHSESRAMEKPNSSSEVLASGTPDTVAPSNSATGSSARGDFRDSDKGGAFRGVSGFFCGVSRPGYGIVNDPELRILFDRTSAVDSSAWDLRAGMVSGGARSMSAWECRDPIWLEFQSRKKSDQAFFKAIHGKAFQGPLELRGTIDPAWVGKNLEFHFHSNPKNDALPREYSLIGQDLERADSQIFENRLTVEKDNIQWSWRQNLCRRSFSLLQSGCPWKSGMDMEFKDFFYFEDSDQLGVNVYCKKKKDRRWTRVGDARLSRRDR
jgi:hypothetical protein